MIPTPVAQGRHALMDAARGFAILGILWLNIFIFALPLDAMGAPGMWGETMWGSVDPNVEVANLQEHRRAPERRRGQHA